MPLVVGLLADLSGQPLLAPPKLKARRLIDIDRDNFNEVMQKIAPRLDLSVPDTTPGKEGSLKIELNFKDFGDFHPDAWERRQYEYLLVPNRRHDATTEIHSIVSVTLSDPRSERSDDIPRLFADTGGAGDLGHVRGTAPLSWTMRRSTSLRPGINGSDVHVALVERSAAGAVDDAPIVYASLLRTNRLLATPITPHTRFYGEGVAKSTVIRALYQPSAPRAPAMDSQALWALVALLRLNHRSLVDGSAGVATLRAMLELFASDSTRDAVQIRGIRQLTASVGSTRIAVGGGWRRHCRGTDIVLEFNEDDYASASALMLASVLARFFALYTSANAFVRLRVTRGGEPWMAWPPMTGRQVLL